MYDNRVIILINKTYTQYLIYNLNYFNVFLKIQLLGCRNSLLF